MADISKELIEQLVKQVVLEKWVKVPNMLIQVVFIGETSRSGSFRGRSTRYRKS